MQGIYKTAECVSPAHPDKLCDQISDLILDACLEQDPDSRVAMETMGGHGQIYLTGELTTAADVDIQQCVSQVLIDNRYDPSDYKIFTNIVSQSPDIARGVDTGGAGDQGIMVGYATRESEQLIPLELALARELLKRLWYTFDDARDAKSQISLLDGKIRVIVLSAERISKHLLREFVDEFIAGDGKGSMVHPGIQVFINEAGDWSNGGFEADTGLT